jgi:SAM-dependent methyltransferase
MNSSHRQADYDQIAGTYDKRYERNPYAGVEHSLREFIGKQPGLRILEVGCGTGHWLGVLQAPARTLVGLDYSAGMLLKARTRLPETILIRGNAEYLPVQARSVDRVFCINALHHFPDKPAFLAEARRLLRPGGEIFSVGLDPHRELDQWLVYHYFPESLMIDRERYPSTGVLREWMTRAGFEHCITQEVEHWTIQLPAREFMAQGLLDKASTSQLSVLTDEEYERGIQRIHEDMQQAEEEGQTLLLTVDLRLYGTIGSV